MTSTADPPTRSDDDGTPQSADSFDGTGAPGTGRGFVLRHGLPYAVTMIATNACGAAVTFLYAATVIVPKRLDSRGTHQLGVNLLAFLIYLAASLLVGTAWSVLRFRPTLAWLLDDRSPTTRERSITLRQPLRQLVVHAVLWLVGVALFFALNAGYDLAIARDAALATALGGLFTVALGYLLSEHQVRPIIAITLESGVPSTPQLPGVAARALLSWTLGTGVVLLGLWLVGLGSLVIGNFTVTQLGIVVIVLSCIGFVVGLAAMSVLANSLAHPIEGLREAVAEVERGDFDHDVTVDDGSEVGLLQAGFNRMLEGLRERERIRDLFGRQVGEDVVQHALEHGVELGGEAREAAILFVDLQGSTQLAQERDPADVVSLLNAFFAIVVEVVAAHDGWVNKFEGDAALCAFGVPLEDQGCAGKALAAGRELAQRLDDEIPDLNAGIGISAGRVVAGNVGAAKRFEYTVIGDPVNEAARLSELAKRESRSPLASGPVLQAAGEDERKRWRACDEVTLRGRSEATQIATPDTR
jgi:adenylate cyclase